MRRLVAFVLIQLFDVREVPQGKLSFIRADLYDAVRRRIMMDMTVRDCQLAKLYAYNGLMLSSGARVEGIDIDRPHRVIVVENHPRTERLISVITVEDDGSQDATRKYHRVEKTIDIPVICFDGEGLISPRFAKQIDKMVWTDFLHLIRHCVTISAVYPGQAISSA